MYIYIYIYITNITVYKDLDSCELLPGDVITLRSGDKAHVWVLLSIRIYLNMCVYMYIYIYVYIYIERERCIHMCIYVYIHTYIYYMILHNII